MNKAIVSYLILISVAGCAHRNPPAVSQVPVPAKSVVSIKKPLKIPRAKKSVLKQKGKGNQVFWRLAGVPEVTLILRNLASPAKPVLVPLTQDIFFQHLPSGDWQITGFKIPPNTYTALNTTQKAVFKVYPRTYTYAGALIINCPKVGQESFDDLKLMKFFNRYSFSTGSNLCEMVVGNDYDLIKDAWKNPKNSKTSTLTLGL